MMYCKTASGELITVKDDDYLEHLDFPAWSLHRLIEIVPKLVKVPKPNYGWNGEDLMFHINDELHILYEDLCIENEEYRFCSNYFYKSNLYDNFIDCIEWLIKEDYFNKEYLEE